MFMLFRFILQCSVGTILPTQSTVIRLYERLMNEVKDFWDRAISLDNLVVLLRYKQDNEMPVET